MLDSYTGRFDVLVEAVQNSMDALEKKWGDVQDFADAKPRLEVELDAGAEIVRITDNGIGIEQGVLLEALVPNLSPKSFDPEPTRGHKGVGTTFLAYGHPSFEIRTKVAGASELAYRIDGGLTWTKQSSSADTPEFKRATSGESRLGDRESGTQVVIGLGEGTRFGRLATAQYNKLETWALVLRTFTAVGHVSVGVPKPKWPAWLQNLEVELSLIGAPKAGTQQVEVGFHLPHHDATNRVSVQALSAGTAPAHKRFELLYGEYDNPQLETILEGPLQELSDSEHPDEQEILNLFRRYDVSVYASWANVNTWYEEEFRTRIGEEAKRYGYNNVRSGLLVTSVGMPIGETNDHPYVTMKPEYKRRLFMIVSFNDRYSPDLGRKTIPTSDRMLLQWLEVQIQKIFLKHVGRLQKSNDEATHKSGSYDEAKEQLKSDVTSLRKKWEAKSILSLELGLAHAPSFENELMALFVSMHATGYLPGYQIVSLPGSTSRYDGLFDFETSNFSTAVDDAVPIGVSSSKAVGGTLRRTDRWLEFKLRLEDLADNFSAEDGDPSKKYFDLCDLAVAWEVPLQDAIGDYDLEKFDESNWHERTYYGATHRLSSSSADHRVEVIALRPLIASLAVGAGDT